MILIDIVVDLNVNGGLFVSLLTVKFMLKYRCQVRYL